MKNLYSIFISLIICSTTLFSIEYTSKNIDIQALKKDFYEDVLKKRVYKKRFKKYLNAKCIHYDNNGCYRRVIEKIEQWETTQLDYVLAKRLKNIYKLMTIDKNYWSNIKKKVFKDFSKYFNKSQFVSIIDLSKQLYILVVWDNYKKRFYFVGSDLISSGDMDLEEKVVAGEDHYFNSPEGLFKAKSGWRSTGKTLDDNITLPYGKKDRYIFYFGKQLGVRYNTFDSNKTKIHDKTKWKLIKDSFEFAMHAHQSTAKFGKKSSHGCIRTSEELNIFLDNNFVLHKSMVDDGKWIHPYLKKPKEQAHIQLVGEYLIVFDKI